MLSERNEEFTFHGDQQSARTDFVLAFAASQGSNVARASPGTR
jgi:hypothetical protein